MRFNRFNLFGVIVSFAMVSITALVITFTSVNNHGIESENADNKTSLSELSGVAASNGKYIQFQSSTPPIGNCSTTSIIPLPFCLNETTTGIIGGVSQGECTDTAPGTTDKYDHLRKFSGAQTINTAWLNSNNGGSKTLTNFDISGSVFIATYGVTLKCGRVVVSNTVAIDNQGATSTTIEWVESVGNNTTAKTKNILGGGYTLYRSNNNGGGDAVHNNQSNTSVIESYVHDMNAVGDDHVDGLQLTKGGGSSGNENITSKDLSLLAHTISKTL